VTRVCAIALALCACAAGCPDPRPTGQPVRAATSAPSIVGFKGLAPHEVVSGPLRVASRGSAGAGLELLANGRPIAPLGRDGAAVLDTTLLPDGLLTLALAANRGGGRSVLATLPVIVLNRGSEVFFKNGSGGTIAVPPTGIVPHQHLRYHWDMGEGVKRLLALLAWQGEGFELELAVGRGSCPHQGQRLAGRRGSRSPIAVEHAAPESGSLGGGQWFAHVALENPARVAGRETSFSVRAFLLR
jgi:hypothetical protein